MFVGRAHLRSILHGPRSVGNSQWITFHPNTWRSSCFTIRHAAHKPRGRAEATGGTAKERIAHWQRTRESCARTLRVGRMFRQEKRCPEVPAGISEPAESMSMGIYSDYSVF